VSHEWAYTGRLQCHEVKRLYLILIRNSLLMVSLVHHSTTVTNWACRVAHCIEATLSGSPYRVTLSGSRYRATIVSSDSSSVSSRAVARFD